VKEVWFVKRSPGAVLWLKIQRGFDRNAAELGYVCVGVREQSSPVKARALLATATAPDETLQKADTVQNGSHTITPSHAYFGGFLQIMWDWKTCLTASFDILSNVKFL